MTPDVIGAIIAGFGLAGSLFGGNFMVMRRMERRLETRIDGVENRLGARIDGVEDRFDKLESKLDQVVDDVTELKIAVARLEGPPPTLLLAR